MENSKTSNKIKVKTRVLLFGLQKLVSVEGLDRDIVKENKRALTFGGDNLKLFTGIYLKARRFATTSDESTDYKLINETIETSFTKEVDMGILIRSRGPTYVIRTYEKI